MSVRAGVRRRLLRGRGHRSGAEVPEGGGPHRVQQPARHSYMGIGIVLFVICYNCPSMVVFWLVIVFDSILWLSFTAHLGGHL